MTPPGRGLARTGIPFTVPLSLYVGSDVAPEKPCWSTQ